DAVGITSPRQESTLAKLRELLTEVLRKQGQSVTPQDDGGLRHDPSGLLIRPELLGVQPQGEGRFSTTTLIHVEHPAFGGAHLVEYQHSFGASAENAIAEGFEQWRQMDLVALLDALREKPEQCLVIAMDFGATSAAGARRRRVVLSPVAHYVERPLPPPPPNADAEQRQHGSFCPCCLFTNTMEAFMPLLETGDFLGVRFYAARDQNGVAQADCRVNGEDYEPGKNALLQYIPRWPDQRLEFRKQYAVIQNAPAETAGGC